MKRRTKRDLIALIIVIIIGAITIPNARTIGDWWHFKNYVPGERIALLADESGMNETGKRLFYRFNPQFVTPGQMQEKCDIVRLGCIEGNNIYILQDQQNPYSAVVTAAHEMLHVAYSRLSETERESVHDLIDEYIQTDMNAVERSKLAAKLNTYPTEDYYPEAHSFLGSETAQLSTALESYYRNYFADRQKLVEAFKKSPEGYENRPR